MCAAQPQYFSATFDALAARYDETFTSSAVGRAQRNAVWKELTNTFRAGQRILEIGCGTGVDANFLAKQGVGVLACDPSAKMIDLASRRAAQNGFKELIHTRVLRAEELSALSSIHRFDGAFSNFGALNCVADLRTVAQGLGERLNPGATALLCWMGPCCLWEIAWYLGQGNKKKAFRRFNRKGAIANLGDNAFVEVHYHSVWSLVRAFGPEFRLISVRGVGVAVPPSYMETQAQRHPHLLALCERVDSLCARWPGIRLIGDHVLVRLQRV